MACWSFQATRICLPTAYSFFPPETTKLRLTQRIRQPVSHSNRGAPSIESRLVKSVPEIGISLNKLARFARERKIVFSLSNTK
jgi:hypothetical protein